jgi:hypothetical protein
MAVYILVTFSIMKSQAKEDTFGQMARPLRVIGIKIKCMVMVYLFGKTVRNMRDILLMTKETDRVSSLGRMVESMMAHGRMENSMDVVNSYQKKDKRK